MRLLDKYNLFIFDWDGTLTTTPSFDTITKRIKPRYRMDYITRNKRKYLQQNAENVRLEKREAAEHSLFSSLYDIYSTFFPPKLMPGAVELLELLKSRRKKMAIFSDAKNYRLMKEMHDLGVAKYFDYALSAESIRAFKPSPVGIEFIVRELRSSRLKTLYVGDFVSDVMASKFAGVDMCAVAAGISPYSALEETKPDYLFHDLAEMTSRLRKA